MKNRFLSVILGLTLCLGASVLPANAQTVRSESAAAVNVQAYQADRIEPFSGIALSAAGTQNTFTGANLQIYNLLKEEAAKVANGTRDSSIIEINTAGMGISYINGTLHGVDTSAIMRALSADCPYELYWFDKTAGSSSSGHADGRDGSVSSITFQFAVSQDYAVTNAAGNAYYLYQPDPAKTRAAAAVIQNAQALVERSRGLSDYEKLTAYRDYICNQVTYNDAVANSINYPYGGPWQLIYVFDDDPGTNVVCEGYAKAFKYLCDLTDFTNSVDCYIVSGRTTGDHMWNIVRINGRSYLADVTNSDVDGAGEYGGLFLVGAPNATANGCTINIPRHNLGGGRYIPAQSMNYIYGTETKAAYDSSILTLAASDYVASDTPPADDPQPAAPAFTDVPAGQWYANAVNWAVGHEITNGTGNGEFSPAQDCTQEQILTFLYRAARGGSTAASAADMAAAIGWAREKGMIDGSFNGKTPCTRATAVSYIWQALDMPSTGGGSFSDVAAGAPYAAAVAWAVETGVTDGTGSGQFSPDKVCDRGTIVTFLHRAYVPGARLK